ncbi:FAD binding domain-containing protein [Aestuariibius sp. 2305UL40-4]|uniref:FAD binding domain-containing protein n=1 Tax=Aestuariibius violaceus TaxID=3234132 RepID=UPI00345E3385
MYAFDLERPTTIQDAVAALKTEEAQPLGGGQTLIPTLKQRLAMPSKLVSLHGISEMKGICADDSGRICIGGATTHGEVAAGAGEYPALAYLAGRIGDPAVRARGTIGGSLANNDPSACYPAGALASGATILTDKREIAADDYFQGMFATALDEGEIITEVKFPVPEQAAYMKFIQPASRFPLTAVFVAKFADGVRVAVTGASEEGVFRWGEAESALSGNFSADGVSGLSVDRSGMIGDLHGTKDYRAHLVGVITKRAVAAAAAGEAGGTVGH